MALNMGEESCDLRAIMRYNSTVTGLPFTAKENNPIQISPKTKSRRKGGKRSTRACATCRARKVRCNVIAHGIPCSNCAHDEVECTLPAKRRRATEKTESSLRGSLESYEDADTRENMENNLEHICSRLREQSEPQHRDIHSNSIQSYSITEPLASDPQKIPADSTPLRQNLSRTISWVQSPLASALPTQHSSPSTHSGSSLSGIFTPFPSYLDAGDFSYLQSHDALTLPSEDLQLGLLKAYIEFVHGSMPVLDLEEFLTIVKYGNGGLEAPKREDNRYENAAQRKISFLLFQAVMFAGVGYVSTRVLKEAGYESRESAKRIFFRRVKLLYNFDVCVDRLSTVQSLLLMTLCPSTSHRETQDAWHWLGLAISLSYVLGLNRNTHLPNSKPRQQHLERRIWWIAFIRDRTLSLRSSFASYKPVRIKKEDSHIAMLSLVDFDLDENADRYEGVDELRMRIIAVECVEKAMMCWCSKDALVSSFSLVCLSTSFPSPEHPIIPQAGHRIAGYNIDNEYDDYFEYIQNTMEEQELVQAAPLEDDGLRREIEGFPFGIDYHKDDILEI